MIVIETSLIMTKDDKILSGQSRELEVQSWEEYVEVYKQYDGEAKGYFPSTNHGYVIPQETFIDDCNYGDYCLLAFERVKVNGKYQKRILFAQQLNDEDYMELHRDSQ